ncbi:helix-turn-helix domain-containing protein [Streptomyces sp. NPDC049590]|uniref:AraC family transcriptional regulator n=1 Tax=Streptomyces sp. NPDC049590 TaxID=3154834 RepID=UPI00342ACA89
MSGFAVRLTPMAGYRLFGLPMHECDAAGLEAPDLLPRSLRTLPEQLREAAPHERPRLLDRVLSPLLRDAPAVAPEVLSAWEELRRTGGRVCTAHLAARALCSVRHLERLFRTQVGRSPAVMARILRFNHALRLQALGAPLPQVAREAGFYDQAHLGHVFRSTVGLTPARFARERIDWRSALTSSAADERGSSGPETGP